MAIELKPVGQQVIVITGASSGIGLATAQEAVRRGAKVALIARSGETLDEIAARLGDNALALAADVADRSALEEAASAVIARWGRIDTWINDAGIAVYARLDEIAEEDARRLFDTNFWGVVNGSMVALPHLRRQGGALINVGSEVSEAVAPLLGMYAASKHAVKGYTDALRIEIEEVDGANVAITLIQPTATNTPFAQNARNYQEKEAKLPTPMIEPEQVAEAILRAAEKHTRADRVGAMAVINTTVAKLGSSLGDKMAAKQVDRQHYDEKPRDPEGALYKPSQSGQVHGSGGVEPK